MAWRANGRGTGWRRLPAGIAACALAIAVASVPVKADITSSATAQASYGGRAFTSQTREFAVPVVSANPQLMITKTSTDTAQSAAGQVITGTYVLTNTGNQTLTDVALQSGGEAMAGGETLSADAGIAGDSHDTVPGDGVWSSLAPGDSVAFTATYAVTFKRPQPGTSQSR